MSEPGGSFHMTLRPEDGKRIEWTWANAGEFLPLHDPFAFEISTGVAVNDVPDGHEWIGWQVHPADEPDLANANPIIALIFKDGMARVDIWHEFSRPYDKANKVQLTIAGPFDPPRWRLVKWRVDGRFGEDGEIRVRRDGVLIADYKGPIGYHATKPPYRKAGIYKWQQPWEGKIAVRVMP